MRWHLPDGHKNGVLGSWNNDCQHSCNEDDDRINSSNDSGTSWLAVDAIDFTLIRRKDSEHEGVEEKSHGEKDTHNHKAKAAQMVSSQETHHTGHQE